LIRKDNSRFHRTICWILIIHLEKDQTRQNSIGMELILMNKSYHPFEIDLMK